MTLVATICRDGSLIVVGDMLITFEDGGDRENLELPTMGDVSRLPEHRRGIEGLRQKVCIISDELAVAYAGDVRRAARVLNALKNLARVGKVDRQSLQKFYEAWSSHLSTDVALIGFLVSREPGGECVVSRFCWNGTIVDDPGLGEIHCAGTGGTLLKAVAKDGLIDPSGFGTLPPRWAAIAKALSLCGHLLNEEQTTLSQIAVHSTGGAFELAFFDGHRFIKPPITFVTWHWIVVNGIVQVSDPRFIMKSAYVGNVHLLNCVRRLPHLVDGQDFWKPDLHSTYPIYEPSSTIPRYDHPGRLGFQSTLTQHQISIMHEGRRVKYASIVEVGPSALIAECGAGTFKIVCDDAFTNKLKEVALN